MYVRQRVMAEGVKIGRLAASILREAPRERGRGAAARPTEHLRVSMRQINDIIGGVSKDWQPQFRQFVETGKLDKGFEAYLNEDPAAQQAFDEVLDAQAAAFS